MPSFDIVSKIDGQTLDNAINTAKKEILNRYDFNDSKSTIDLDKKTNVVTIVTENDMRLKAITDSIISRHEPKMMIRLMRTLQTGSAQSQPNAAIRTPAMIAVTEPSRSPITCRNAPRTFKSWACPE